MPDWNIQKGVAITDTTPTGVAGGYLNTNFEALRDEAPYNSAAAPTATDDSTAGFFAGSHWFDTTTQTMWVCTDATASAARWRSMYRRESGAIVLAPNGDGAIETPGKLFVQQTLFAQGRLSGQLTMSPGVQGGGSQFITGFQNELANWESRGGTLSTSTTGGASVATPQYAVQPQNSGDRTATVSFTSAGSVTFEFTGLGSFEVLSSNKWGAYLQSRAAQTPSEIKIELQEENTDTWVVVWNDTNPLFELNLWYSGIKSAPLGSGVYPKGFRITLTYADTNSSYIRAIGFYHQNRALGTYVYPFLFANNDFVGNNTFNGSVQVDNLQLDGNTLSATDTNGDVILAPNGNGALQADSGGDLRGNHAVDFQKVRSAATEVASGNYSTIGGGFHNTASNSLCVVGGGNNNTAGGSRSVISGGDTNEASGTRSFVGGGSNNVASGARATVCGGASSTASGSNSIIAGGSANTASEQNSAVAGGFSNIASGAYSFVGAGRKNTSSGKYAVSMGARAVADHFGQSAQGAGHFALPGDAQSSVLVARRSTTNATATELTLDGATPSAQGRITLVDQNCWLFKIHVVARRTDADNEGAAFEFTGCIDRNGATTALIGSVTKTVIARDVVAWDANVTADDTNESLKIEVTGEASKTIRWVARVQLVEVSG